MKDFLQKLIAVGIVALLLVGPYAFPYPQRAHALTCGFGSNIAGGMCRGYLTSGTTFSVPADWTNSNNTVEAIGGGGNGGAGNGSTFNGGGGGGGAYAKSVNLTLSGSITYQVGGAAQDTWFNSVSFPSSGQAVGAKAGVSGSANTGGAGGSAAASYATGTGSLTYSGGAGPNWNSGPSNMAGGGAAGPHGAGAAGGASAGGTGDAGFTAANTAGTQWDATHGSGGGGNSASVGALYGGGAGGSSLATPAGAQGIIVITYLSTTATLNDFLPHTTLTINANVKALSNFNVRGPIAKGSGTFVIDDPLDPENKLLYHSFVESPDVKNMYDGIATLNTNGEVTIPLPDYYDALNYDTRYQYFPLDQAMPTLYIKEQENKNHFTIAGGVPGGRVSWQVTGIRHDPYILAHPITPEVDKGPNQPVNKGVCLFKPLC